MRTSVSKEKSHQDTQQCQLKTQGIWSLLHKKQQYSLESIFSRPNLAGIQIIVNSNQWGKGRSFSTITLGQLTHHLQLFQIKLDSYPPPYNKISSKYIEDANVKQKSWKYLKTWERFLKISSFSRDHLFQLFFKSESRENISKHDTKPKL